MHDHEEILYAIGMKVDIPCIIQGENALLRIEWKNSKVPLDVCWLLLCVCVCGGPTQEISWAWINSQRILSFPPLSFIQFIISYTICLSKNKIPIV